MLLLKVLFIAILIMWIVRILFLRLLPYLLAKFFVNLQRKAQYQQQGYGYTGQNNGSYAHTRDDYTRASQQGKVKIDYIPPQAKRKASTNNAGEFVDYEEIK
ncbi:DUF4834 family protein [Olivibacter sitiensis]|uniref:DUF4834 family protein n=1 Tax=Olivibacter sitiensis TaxID=376470 RepID=UPI000563C55F|nr:DUF4834 family protein [Olivibacter sitiensis]